MANILIVTQCTKAKTGSAGFCRAGEMYKGKQHLRIMAAAGEAARYGHNVNVAIISAKHGLKFHWEKIETYDETFNDKSKDEIIALGSKLNIPFMYRQVIKNSYYDYVAVALGEEYALAAGLNCETAYPRSTTIFGNKVVCEWVAEKGTGRLDVVGIGNDYAKQHRVTSIEAKGHAIAAWIRDICGEQYDECG